MKKFLPILSLLLFGALSSFAQRTWDGGAATNNWGDAANWSGDVVPTATDAVTLINNTTVNVNVPGFAASITFPTGNANNVTLNVTTSLTVTGSITIPRSAGATKNLLAIGAGTLTAGSIDFTSSGTAVRHEMTISTGTATVGNITADAGAGGSPSVTFTGTGTVKISGTMFTNALGTLTQSTGTVEYNGAGAQTLGDFVYNNLTLSNAGVKTTTGVTVNNILSMEGTATVSAAPTYAASAAILQYNTATARTAGAEWVTPFTGAGVVITNTGVITLNAAKVFNAGVDLTIDPGAGLNTSGSNFALSFGGDFINNGIFTANASPITITLGSAQNIGGFTSTGLVSMTKNGATATFTGNVNAGGLTINGSGTGTLNLGVGLTHTFTGTWTRTAGTLNGGSSTLDLSATPGPVSGTGGTFTAGTGTVEYSGAGVQTIAAVIYNNLTLSGSGLKTIGASTVNGKLSMQGTASASAAPTYGGTATLEYAGSAAQNTGVEFAATVPNLIIDNTSGVTLSASRTVSTTLTLTNGNLIIPSGLRLTVTSTNAIAGTGFSAAKSVVTQVDNGTGTKGFLRVSVPAALRTIPVSDGTNYLPVSLTPLAANDVFDVCVFTGITTNGEPNGTAFTATQKSFVVDAVWYVNFISGTGPSVTMTTNWPGTLEGAVFATNPDNRIGIAHYGAAWETVTGTGNQGANTATRTAITAFSPFGVGGINKPLPIAINYFNAAKGNGYNTLNWQASCSAEKAVFEVERSTDGKNFTTISTVIATQAECAQSVTYVDNNNLSGAVFYRIKSVDASGKADYSVIIKLGGKQSDIRLAGILPNPVMNTAQLNIVTAKKDNVNLSIVSMEGKLVQRSTVQLQPGSSIISLDVTNLQKGVYIIKGVFGDGEASSIKFVKQ